MSPLAEDQKLEVWKMIQDFHDSKVLPLHKENQTKMDALADQMTELIKSNSSFRGAAYLAIVLIPLIVFVLEKLLK